MYEKYYNLSCDPFRLRPRAGSCFEHQAYSKAHSYLMYALQKGEGMLLVTGMPGTGKTTLIRNCVNQYLNFNVQFVEISCGNLSGEDIIFMAATKLGVTISSKRRVAYFAAIEARLMLNTESGGKTVLIIDEAQSLTDDALDELKNLANLEHGDQPLLQIFLVGQESLKERLQKSEMSQVMQRVSAACVVGPMTAAELPKYVEHCIRVCSSDEVLNFDDDLFSLLYWNTGGVPRKVNLICGRLLLRGMVNKSSRIKKEDLESVLDDLRDEGLIPPSMVTDSSAPELTKNNEIKL